MENGKLESQLQEGMDVVLTPSNRMPELEDRFNIHLGHVYRAIISGTNRGDCMNFDGVLTRIDMYVDSKGFTPNEIELENGLMFPDFCEKKLFDRKVIRKRDCRIINFGSIIDEAGFYRARKRIAGELK